MSQPVRAAFAATRTGHYDTARNYKAGRLDSRSLPRIAANDYRLFAKRNAPSEDRYLVWVMVDCSSSMSGNPMHEAARLAAGLATASRSIPNIRLDIWGWTSGWKMSAGFGAVRVWGTGDPIANVGYLQSVPQKGTPDGQTLRWAGQAIRKAARPGEKPMIVFASDGQGHLTPEIVAAIRKQGVEVVSVAIGWGVDEHHQRFAYGDHGYIPWAGSIREMARPLGKFLARATQGRAK